MSKVLIRGATLCYPHLGSERAVDLLFVPGQVLGMDPKPSQVRGAEEVDGRGRWLIPGLVDLAARLREPGATHKADIRSEVTAALLGGITHLVLPPDTRPAVDSTAVVELILRRAREGRGATVHAIGALTRDLGEEALAEMGALRAAGCIAVGNIGRPLGNSNLLRRALQYAASLDLPVHLQAIDPWIGAGGVAHEGRVAALQGLPGIPETTETLALARDLMLVEEAGVRAHFARLSCARSVALIADARRRGLRVSADVAMPNLFLNEHDVLPFRADAHLLPPLRTSADRDALRAALADGTIDAVCSDHQPHDPDAKLRPFPATEPGASGVDSFLGLGLKLVQEGVLSRSAWLERAALAPRRILGLPLPTLEAGALPDFVLVDPRAEYTLDAATMMSRGKNTPFRGWRLPGRVDLAVIADRLWIR
ncbi:MAG: dihydroorotase [Xanthomonadales bacterium]|nr:Dihydroorotase-like protein [Xanthomonadales bacterium]MCC6593597.1 dihydroorotase [Xanthomonadales bacterium]MCE7931763.1 dihydroorotase [Xanthomonadales bacterium PRO6]